MTLVYLDNNATTRVAPEVVDAMMPYLTDRYGNPSSMHRAGAKASGGLKEARERAAAFLHCRESEVVFTSGGTESNNMAIRGIVETFREKRLVVTTRVEHPSVLEVCKQLEHEGYPVTYVGVDRDGLLDLSELEHAITDQTALVSIMWANNETGVIFPIDEIAGITRRRGVLLHVDGVQVAAQLPIDLEKTPIDLLTLSGHKLHAPKGVGILFIRREARIRPLIIGGGQERGRRSGTENLPGIVGLGKSFELAGEHRISALENVRRLRDKLETAIFSNIPDAARNGAPEPRLPNTSHIRFEGVEGEAVLLLLDEAGICASGGSACSTGALEPSHVLKAMGISGEAALGAVRFSLSRDTTEGEIDRVLEVLPAIVQRLRNVAGAGRGSRSRGT